MKSLKELLEEKKKVSIDSEDIEKIEVIEELLIDETSFFDLDIQTFYGILDFLGVPEDEFVDYYNSMLSLEKFNEIPNVRIINDNINNERGI